MAAAVATIVSGPVRLSVPAWSEEPAPAGCGDAFAGDERTIEIGLSAQHPAIDRDALAGGQQDRHARLDLVQREIDPPAVRSHDERAARREAGKTLHGGAGPFPHHVIERAPDQQEEQ